MANIFNEAIDAIKEKVFPVSLEKKDISIDDSDEVLVPKLDLRVEESEAIRRTKLFDWKRNLQWFNGDQWAATGIILPTYKSDIFINKIFASFRSLVAYETDAKPQPVVDARLTETIQNPDAVVLTSKKIESALDYLWDLRQVPITLTEVYYDRYLFNDGYGMYFWNAIDDNPDFELVKPQEILRSPGATTIDDAEYIIVEKWRNRTYFQKNYPDLVDKIKFEDSIGTESTNDPFVEKAKRDNLAKVHYYFEDDLWIFKCGKVILEKSKNKYWEWRDEAEQKAEMMETFGVSEEEFALKFPDWKPVKNHLSKPEKPVIQFKGYHLGGEFESRSLIKQLIKLNENINKRKCQWQDILDGTGVPQWVVDPSVPQDQVEKITSKPGLKIRINPSLIRKEAASAPPQGSFEDMLHTEKSFNDMSGLHEVSYGAASSKRTTKGEVELLKESDIVPIRLLMRNSESAIIRLLNGWVQLMKLYYDQKHYLGTMGNEGLQTYGQYLTRGEIPDDLLVTIKVGSTMPVSRGARRDQYRADFQMGAISLKDYLTMMEYQNPDRLVQNLQAQQQMVAPTQPVK